MKAEPLFNIGSSNSCLPRNGVNRGGKRAALSVLLACPSVAALLPLSLNFASLRDTVTVYCRVHCAPLLLKLLRLQCRSIDDAEGAEQVMMARCRRILGLLSMSGDPSEKEIFHAAFLSVRNFV